MEHEEQDSFRPNWLAILGVIFALVIIGWLLGKLSSAPDGQSLECGSAAQVQVIQMDGHVVAYCEE